MKFIHGAKISIILVAKILYMTFVKKHHDANYIGHSANYIVSKKITYANYIGRDVIYTGLRKFTLFLGGVNLLPFWY